MTDLAPLPSSAMAVAIRLDRGRVLYAGMHPDQVARFLWQAEQPDAARKVLQVNAATTPGGRVRRRKIRAAWIASIEPVESRR